MGFHVTDTYEEMMEHWAKCVAEGRDAPIYCSRSFWEEMKDLELGEDIPAPLPPLEGNPLFAVVGGKSYALTPDGFVTGGTLPDWIIPHEADLPSIVDPDGFVMQVPDGYWTTTEFTGHRFRDPIGADVPVVIDPPGGES